MQKLIRYKTLLFMLLPSAALVIIFSYLPIGGLVMAFKRFNYADGIFGSPWVGLDNFRFFFESGKAFTVTRNTALYNLAFILINTVLEIAFAIILSENGRKMAEKNNTVNNFPSLLYLLGYCGFHCLQPSVIRDRDAKRHTQGNGCGSDKLLRRSRLVAIDYCGIFCLEGSWLWRSGIPGLNSRRGRFPA